MATAIPIITANYQSSTVIFPGSSIAAATDMYFINNGITVFLVDNQSGGNITVTVTSVPDAAGRGNNSCDDLAVTVADDGIVMFGPFTPVWWNQPNGTVLVTFSGVMNVNVIGLQIA